MHCRIPECFHKLINTKACISHQLKQKIILPILFLNRLKFNQRFKTLSDDIPAIIK